ncbi:MAG: hypothetical protein VW644_02840 [Alphaproteobacteria bacterium]
MSVACHLKIEGSESVSPQHFIIPLLSCLALAACGTYSATEVKPVGSTASTSGPTPGETPDTPTAPAVKSGRPPTDPAKIIVTKGDITDRKYQAIGDIEVTVNKATIFDKDPTPALVDEQLREEAAAVTAASGLRHTATR